MFNQKFLIKDQRSQEYSSLRVDFLSPCFKNKSMSLLLVLTSVQFGYALFHLLSFLSRHR
jgi:hypothetical protein